MEDLLQLNLLLTSVDKKIPGKNKTPGDVGNNLFRDLLMKDSGSSSKENWGLSLYQGAGSNRGIPENDSGERINSLKKLDKKIRTLGVPGYQMMLPGSALPHLISFLEKQGISSEKIDQLIVSAKNSEGFINLDRLLAGLLKGKAGTGMVGKNLIHSRDIPRVEELLLKMGLGVGEVKEIIEKSLNQNGELAMDRLSASLGKFFHGSISERELISLLEHLNIKARPQVMDNRGIGPDLKKELQHFSETISQDIQKKIKQNIAGLLREKGIPPQEVKSFLETLTVDSTRSLLYKPDSPAIESTALLNRVVIRSQSEWNKGGWKEKILEILNKENLLSAKDTNRNWFQGEGTIRLNLAEILKQGEKGAKITFAHSIPATRQKEHVEIIMNQGGKVEQEIGQKSGDKHHIKEGLQVKDGLAGDFTLKMDREIWKGGPVNHIRNTSNMPAPLPKILDRMIWMIRAGEQRGRILIHPPELGRLDLDMVIKQGHLQIQLGAENGLVKDLIEAHLSQLRQQLTEQGFIVDKFEVTVGLGDRRFPEGDARMADRRKGHSPKKSNTKADDLPVQTESIRSTNNLYQIDLQV